MNPIRLKRLRDTILCGAWVTKEIQGFAGKFARGFAATAVVNLGITLSAAIGGILLARLLGSRERGVLAAAVVWTGIVQVVASMGLPQALTYFVASDPSGVGSVFSAMLVILVVQSVAALMIAQSAVVELLARFQPAAVGAVRVYLFSVPFSLLITYVATMAQGLKRFDLFNAPRVASSLVYVMALVLAVILGLREAGEVATLLLVAQIMVAVAAFVWFWVQVRPRGHFEWQLVQKLLQYGLKSYVGNLSWMANARLDQFIMSALVDLEVLGHYAVAVSYATVLFPLSGAFAATMFPNVVGGERDVAVSNISGTLKLNVLLSAGGALVLGLLTPVLLPFLFGVEFCPSVAPARILLVGAVLLGCNYVLSDGLRGMGFPLLPSIAEVLGFATTIGGLILLLPPFGILGAAWTSVLSYGAAFAFLFIAVGRLLNSRRSAL